MTLHGKAMEAACVAQAGRAAEMFPDICLPWPEQTSGQRAEARLIIGSGIAAFLRAWEPNDAGYPRMDWKVAAMLTADQLERP